MTKQPYFDVLRIFDEQFLWNFTGKERTKQRAGKLECGKYLNTGTFAEILTVLVHLFNLGQQNLFDFFHG